MDKKRSIRYEVFYHEHVYPTQVLVQIIVPDADNQINPDGNGWHCPKEQVNAREYDPHIVSNRYCIALQ